MREVKVVKELQRNYPAQREARILARRRFLADKVSGVSLVSIKSAIGDLQEPKKLADVIIQVQEIKKILKLILRKL